jgi:hypothetical protein
LREKSRRAKPRRPKVRHRIMGAPTPPSQPK